jgi:hypothetical protein
MFGLNHGLARDSGRHVASRAEGALETLRIVTRGIAALATFTALLVLAPVANADPPCSIDFAHPQFSNCPLPSPTPPSNDGCHPDGYGSHEICPGPRSCGPFACSDGSPSPG